MANYHNTTYEHYLKPISIQMEAWQSYPYP